MKLLSSMLFLSLWASAPGPGACAAVDSAAPPASQAQLAPAASTASAAQSKPLVRPKPGDKLGYSKEESTQRLAPEYRALLDGVLRLYREPGLFARRSEAFATIGAVPGRIEVFTRSVPRRSETDQFRQHAVAQGLFAREGWAASYEYNGRETRDGKTTWHALLSIQLPYKQDCVDSRAVEGYLDLYLYPGIDGHAHPVPSRLWDRHGITGSPFARPIAKNGPGITLGFGEGCLGNIFMGSRFNLEEVSDEQVIH